MPLEPLPRLLREIADLVLASTCAGCGIPGASLCEACRSRLSSPVLRIAGAGTALRAGLAFEGVAASVLRAVKESGQTSLLTALRPALAAAAEDLLGGAPVAAGADVLVPIPTSRAAFRRRGFRVPDLLARGLGPPVVRVLRQTRRIEDQRGLGVAERGRNLDGALAAVRPGGGLRALIVDDVITTGATCSEAARALREAGFDVLGAVAVAATPRRPGGAVRPEDALGEPG